MRQAWGQSLSLARAPAAPNRWMPDRCVSRTLRVEQGSDSLGTGTEIWALSKTVLVPVTCSEPIRGVILLSAPSHIQGTGAAGFFSFGQ